MYQELRSQWKGRQPPARMENNSIHPSIFYNLQVTRNGISFRQNITSVRSRTDDSAAIGYMLSHCVSVSVCVYLCREQLSVHRVLRAPGVALTPVEVKLTQPECVLQGAPFQRCSTQ